MKSLGDLMILYMRGPDKNVFFFFMAFMLWRKYIFFSRKVAKDVLISFRGTLPGSVVL